MVPSVSAALAAIANEPGATETAPAAGLVRTTVGAAFTSTVTGADVVVTPWSSVAFAVSVYVPGKRTFQGSV